MSENSRPLSNDTIKREGVLIIDLIDVLENSAKGGKVFPAIRLRRAKERLKWVDKKWNQRLKASQLSFTGCPFTHFQNIEKSGDSGYGDPERNHYLAENSKMKHIEFQEELKKLTLKEGLELYPPPPVDKIHQKCRFKLSQDEIEGKASLYCIELPFFHEYYRMMGFVDGVVRLSKNGSPIIIDFKSKAPIADRSVWKGFVKSQLPLEKDVAQLAAYKYILNDLKYFGKDIEFIGLNYYNCHLIGELDAEQEIYLNPPLDITKYMLDTHLEEMLKYIDNKQTECNYEFCEEHGKSRLRIKDWIIKL